MNRQATKQPIPLGRDIPRLALASRCLLEDRPDLHIPDRATLAELTLQQIERDALPPSVVDAFSPVCSFFRAQALAVTDLEAQRRLSSAEIEDTPRNALPAALGGLSLSPECRALAAEQLLRPTDQPSANFALRVSRLSRESREFDRGVSVLALQRR